MRTTPPEAAAAVKNAYTNQQLANQRAFEGLQLMHDGLHRLNGRFPGVVPPELMMQMQAMQVFDPTSIDTRKPGQRWLKNPSSTPTRTVECAYCGRRRLASLALANCEGCGAQTSTHR